MLADDSGANGWKWQHVDNDLTGPFSNEQMKSTRCSDHSSNILRDCCQHPNKHPVINAFSLIVQATWPALEEFFLPREKNMHKWVSVMCGRGVLYVHSERRLIIATHGKITRECILSVLHMLPPSIFLRTLEVDATVRSIFQKRKLSHREIAVPCPTSYSWSMTILVLLMSLHFPTVLLLS